MNGLDRTSPLPLWAQLAAELRAGIATGDFHHRFPTEEELTARYGVSRNTVREAVRRLRDEGLVERQQGRGTFVAAAEIEQPLRGLYSLARSIQASGLDEHSELVILDQRLAGDRAKLLDLAADEPVIYLERLRFAGDEPLALDRSWLPADRARPLLDADLSRGSLYDVLEHQGGARATGGWERIRSVNPTRADRAALRLPARQAALAVERLVLAGDRPLEWRESLVRGDRYSFVSEWRAGPGGASGRAGRPWPNPANADAAVARPGLPSPRRAGPGRSAIVPARPDRGPRPPSR